ncbi:hypothetical protein FRX31_012598, partial [Thalictrum thalictroides]
MADGTRLKEVDLMTKANKSKLDDVSSQFNRLTETVDDNKKLMEARFEEILVLLGKGKQKEQENEM